MVPELSWEFLVTNPVLAAVIVIAYFQYSLRYGMLGDHIRAMETLIAVVIALSHHVEDVDETKVEEEFNGSDSSYYTMEER